MRLRTEVGCIDDGLPRRGCQVVGCRWHVKPGSELPQHSAIGLSQLQQDVYKFRFASLLPCDSAWRSAADRFLTGTAFFGWRLGMASFRWHFRAIVFDSTTAIRQGERVAQHALRLRAKIGKRQRQA